MKKVREFSKSYIFLSVLYVAVGIVLLLAWQSLSLEVIGRGLGVILIVVGATYGVIYFASDRRQEGFLQMELVIAIVSAALGVFVLLTPEFMSMILPFVMATVLLLGAIVKIQSAVSMKRLLIRRWYVALIAALVIIALGVILLVYPFATDAQMLLYIGICLILDGLTNLIGLFCIQIRSKKLANIQKKNPGVDLKTEIEKEWARSDAAKAEKKAKKLERKSQKGQEIVVDAAEVSGDTTSAAVKTSEQTVSAAVKTSEQTASAEESAAVSENPLITRARAMLEAKKASGSGGAESSSSAEGEAIIPAGDTQAAEREGLDTIVSAEPADTKTVGGAEQADANPADSGNALSIADAEEKS